MLAFVPATGRCKVELESGRGSFKIKVENLRLLIAQHTAGADGADDDDDDDNDDWLDGVMSPDGSSGGSKAAVGKKKKKKKK